MSIITILAVTLGLGKLSTPPPMMFPVGLKIQNVQQGSLISKNIRRFPFHGLRNLTSCFLFLAIGTSIRVTEQWYQNEKLRKEMENQKLTAELSFLKSQINPHFFFNTLNSIYSLAISKSDKTPEAIIKLSELMRFIIYESEKDKVPLRREVEYIQNYVELQKLRVMSNIIVRFWVEGDTNDKKIEPLLLLPFIENAFKHGIDSTKECTINIALKVTKNDLWLIVENPVVKPSMKQVKDPEGIGLSNSKKRLELIYGSNSNLNIINTGDVFKVELNIIFNKDELYYS
ncbi:MAG: histidine kinase [Bacteroidales bacterium]|nr:histidine kinase [Bacteroidales bacterium]